MGHPLIIEYYLFRDLDRLRHKDPGMFPERVADAVRLKLPAAAAMTVDCFGPGKLWKGLVSVYRTRNNSQVSIQFHLTLRTLLFAAVSALVNPGQKVIVKADLTPAHAPTLKTKLVWRLVDRFASLIVCETPEALRVLRKAGVTHAEFVPNDLSGEDVKAAAGLGRRVSPTYDFLFVTRSDDARKSPHLTGEIAQQLAQRGFQVACVGVESPGTHPNVAVFPHLERRALLQLLQSSAMYIGLSRSESFWFLVAEAAALGVPTWATPAGIAPHLASHYEGVKLLPPAWQISVSRVVDDLAAHRSIVPAAYLPYDISGEARERLQNALEARVL